MTQGVIPMMPEFPRWMSGLGIGHNETLDAARWTGVSYLAAIDSPDMTEALIRLTIESRHAPAAAVEQQIRQSFRSADNNFPMQGNEKEMQLLSAATLAAKMASQTAAGAQAGLAVSTALVGGRRELKLPMDLATLAEGALQRLADTERRRPRAQSLKEPPRIELDKASTKAKEGNFEHVATAFGLAAESLRGAVGTTLSEQGRAIESLSRHLRIQDEELQMLWWLIGGRSIDLDRPFDSVDRLIQPLLFAKELAEMTQFVPGPRSVRALLARSGLKEKSQISLKNCVNALEPSWVNSLMTDVEPSPVTTPIHFALKRVLETGQGDAWVAGWAATVVLPADIALPPLTIGTLFYRERLLEK